MFSCILMCVLLMYAHVVVLIILGVTFHFFIVTHRAYVRKVVNFSMCTSLEKCAISCWTPEVSVPDMA